MEIRGEGLELEANQRILDDMKELLDKYALKYMNTSAFMTINKCVDELQQKLFRKPSEDEIAQYMDITKKEVISIRNKMKTSSNISIDHTVSEGEKEFSIIDTIEDEDILCPEEAFEQKELQDVLAKAIDMLKEKDRLVLSLYYYEELTLKEIGEILGVSESRVSQLNNRAISNLRAAMKKLKYID